MHQNILFNQNTFFFDELIIGHILDHRFHLIEYIELIYSNSFCIFCYLDQESLQHSEKHKKQDFKFVITNSTKKNHITDGFTSKSSRHIKINNKLIFLSIELGIPNSTKQYDFVQHFLVDASSILLCLQVFPSQISWHLLQLFSQ